MTFRERLLATLHDDVKARLDQITRLVPSPDEPSVWVPRSKAAELTDALLHRLEAR